MGSSFLQLIQLQLIVYYSYTDGDRTLIWEAHVKLSAKFNLQVK